MPVSPHRDTKSAGTITVPIPLTHRVYTLFKRGMNTVEITEWLNDHERYGLKPGGMFTEAQVYSALARALDERCEGSA